MAHTAANSAQRFGAMALALPRAMLMPARASSFTSEASGRCSSHIVKGASLQKSRKALQVERRSGWSVRCATEVATNKVPDTAPSMSWWVPRFRVLPSHFLLWPVVRALRVRSACCVEVAEQDSSSDFSFFPGIGQCAMFFLCLLAPSMFDTLEPRFCAPLGSQQLMCERWERSTRLVHSYRCVIQPMVTMLGAQQGA